MFIVVSFYTHILSNGAIIGGMLFANDFVGVSDSGEELQKLIDVTVVNGD